jgi:hypothetical protein
MSTLLFILINGFLFSVSSSSVTTNSNCNQSPVIQENCLEKKPIPFVQPAIPENKDTLPDNKHPGIKQIISPACMNTSDC